MAFTTATEGGIAVVAPNLLRRDFGAAMVRRLAVAGKESNQTRRLLALAVICDGGKRTEATKLALPAVQVPENITFLSIPARSPDRVSDWRGCGRTLGSGR